MNSLKITHAGHIFKSELKKTGGGGISRRNPVRNLGYGLVDQPTVPP